MDKFINFFINLIESVSEKYKDNGTESIFICLSFILSPVFTHVLLYNPNFLNNHNILFITLMLLIFTGCLFGIIHFFSKCISGIILLYKLEKNIIFENEDEKINYFDKISIILTSTFMLVLSILLILYYYLNQVKLFPNELCLLFYLIIGYIIISTLSYIYLKWRLKSSRKNKL